MNYTYTIRKVDPENRFLGVIYHSDGMPNYFHNFTTEDFTAAHIAQLIEDYSSIVRLTWENIANPPVPEVTEGEQGAGVAIKNVSEPIPEYDPLLEKVVSAVNYDPVTATYTTTHTVVELTDTEKVQAQKGEDFLAQLASAESVDQVAILAKKTNIDPATLTDEEVRAMATTWPLFEVGHAYAVGDLVYYKQFVYEVVQAHTSQADWRPDVAHSLWKRYRDYGVVEPWVQPQGAHDAYPLGVTVSHNGSNWTSDVANNVWEPGVSQWTEVV